IHFSHRTHFKRWVSDMTIVDTSIAVNDILKETYDAYQILLMDISRKDGKLLKKHLNELANANISDSFKSAIKTLLGYSSYILNALDIPYSNGPIEGLNNYIKVIKRIAFGYKSFFHFRNRILITKNLLKPLKMHQT
ncbi:MAG: transposase, partial [Bacilli bacterium]